MGVILHRAIALGSVCMVLAIAFYGGMKSFEHDANFTPSEVENLRKTCKSDQFIGSCTDCTDCERNEFDSGGCSFFRDTFCTRCEPIEHCDIAKTKCTTSWDSTCSKCDAGHYGDSCKECTVCNEGSYQLNECTQDVDTHCIPCTPCQNGLHLTKACTPIANSECSECSECMLGTFMEYPCETGAVVENVWEHVYDDPAVVYTLQADTVCKTCEQTCGEGKYTSSMCTTARDTECSECSACDEGEFIEAACASGSAEMGGTDTVCKDCVARPGGNFWEVSPCLSTAGSDGVFAECSECLDWEWQEIACGDKQDAVCPQCLAIENCKEQKTRCTSGLLEDSVCLECEAGYSGDQCCYHKTFGECGNNPARERTPYNEGYRGNNNGKFIDFCINLCDGFPDCTAVEVVDGGAGFAVSGSNDLGSPGSICLFMASHTEEVMKDPSMDCYSNTCRLEARGSEYHTTRTVSTQA